MTTTETRTPMEMVCKAEDLQGGDVLINNDFLVIDTQEIADQPESILLHFEAHRGYAKTDLRRDSLHPIRRGTGRTIRPDTLA